MISNIESGHTPSSSFIKEICQQLKMDLPQHYVNDAERHWAALGRALRSVDKELYDIRIKELEAMIKSISKRNDDNKPK